MTIEKQQRTAGILRLREEGLVSLRTKTPAGILTAAQLEALGSSGADLRPGRGGSPPPG